MGDPTAIRAALDAIDAAHSFLRDILPSSYHSGECLCGWSYIANGGDELDRAHAAHVRDVTAEAVARAAPAGMWCAVSHCHAYDFAAFLAAMRGTR